MIVISIVAIVLVVVITLYHFSEGFFTALISAIAAVLAATLAVSYVEPVARLLLHGGGPDIVHAVSLVLLFVVAYAVIRMLFDKLIPGNVRTPSTVDKVGAAILGLVAGTYAVGILVIAWQMLPFGPTMNGLGYSRYSMTGTRSVFVHTSDSNNTTLDSFVYNQLADPTLDPQKQNHLWFPVDDLVLNTVYRLSNGGSLAGARPLASVHPDWLTELFGMRLGMQTNTRRVALALPDRDPVTVTGVYAPAELPTYDGYGQADPKSRNSDTEIRPPGYKPPFGDTLRRSGALVPLVVRVSLRTIVTDDADKVFRFSPAAVRLVTRPQLPDGTFGPGTDSYPIGTYEAGRLVTNRVDDFLFVNMGGGESGFDAVFLVDKSVLVSGKNKSVEVAPGTFVTVKRLAVLDLAGMTVGDQVPADASIQVLRSKLLKAELHPEAK